MKGLKLTLIMMMTAIMSLCSCRRASDNGKIDGYWKIQEIYYIADGTVVNPTNEFISIQLELLQLQAPSHNPKMTAVLSYDKEDDNFSVDFRNNPTDEELAKFGFAGRQSTLHIESVDSKRMVLTSAIARISCRKW